MLDIGTEWTLNASLTTSSSYRKCSKRRILDHSAQATSLLPIEGTTNGRPAARGFGSGRILASVAEPSRPYFDSGKGRAKCISHLDVAGYVSDDRFHFLDRAAKSF
jgi:hypothetical protein